MASDPVEQPGPTRAGARFLDVFAIDVRSLAALRIALGLLVLLDLTARLPDFTAFMTEGGVLPRSLWTAAVSRPEVALPSAWNLSLYLLSDKPLVQGAIFAAEFLFALSMLIGFRTRWSTVLTWLLLMSAQNRMPFILNHGDKLLLLTLFWAMFLPLGAACSVDRALDSSAAPPPPRILSAATVVLTLQILQTYWWAGLGKLDDVIWRDGTALSHVFAHYCITSPVGAALLRVPRLLAAATYVTIVFEPVVPLLVLVPGLQRRTRTVAVLLLMCFHVALQATLLIGMFPLVCIGALAVLLPGWFWDWIAPRTERLHARGAALGRWVVARFARCKRRPLRWRPSWCASAAVVGFALLSFSANLRTYMKLPKPLVNAQFLFRLDQEWPLYVHMRGGIGSGTAPDTTDFDGWIVRAGKLRDGSQVDLARGGPVRWTRPGPGRATRETWYDVQRSGFWWFTNDHRWLNYTKRISNAIAGLPPGLRVFGLGYGRYLCRRWSAEHAANNQLERVTVYSVIEMQLIDPKSAPDAVEATPFLDYRCGDPIIEAR